jgi:hypothetical protein
MSELALASLQRRVKGLHELWREAMSTMDADQVNHHEREGVLPIAFSLNQVVQTLFGLGPTIWDRDHWAERIGVTVDAPGKEQTVAEMELLRIDDYNAFCQYAQAVFASTEAWLDDLPASRMSEVLFGGVVPPLFQKAYVARVVGDGPILMVDGLECWIFQHGIRHLGECEHARALVGLGGLTS